VPGLPGGRPEALASPGDAKTPDAHTQRAAYQQKKIYVPSSYEFSPEGVGNGENGGNRFGSCSGFPSTCLDLDAVSPEEHNGEVTTPKAPPPLPSPSQSVVSKAPQVVPKPTPPLPPPKAPASASAPKQDIYSGGAYWKYLG